VTPDIELLNTTRQDQIYRAKFWGYLKSYRPNTEIAGALAGKLRLNLNWLKP
jgi:hypothetical protein